MRGAAVLFGVLGAAALSGCVAPPLATVDGYYGGYGGAPGYVYDSALGYVYGNAPAPGPVVIDSGPPAYYYQPAVPAFGSVWIGGSWVRDRDHDGRDWNHDRREPPRMRYPGLPRYNDPRNFHPPIGRPAGGRPGYGGPRHGRPGYGNRPGSRPGHGTGMRGPGIAPARGSPPHASPPRAPHVPRPAAERRMRVPDPRMRQP